MGVVNIKIVYFKTKIDNPLISAVASFEYANNNIFDRF